MDSKNIFIAVQHILDKIKWVKVTESEWSYIGDGDEFNEPLANKMISELFDDKIYFVTDKHNSFEIEVSKASKAVQSQLQKTNVTLCDVALTKILEFNKIGVVRKALNTQTHYK